MSAQAMPLTFTMSFPTNQEAANFFAALAAALQSTVSAAATAIVGPASAPVAPPALALVPSAPVEAVAPKPRKKAAAPVEAVAAPVAVAVAVAAPAPVEAVAAPVAVAEAPTLDFFKSRVGALLELDNQAGVELLKKFAPAGVKKVSAIPDEDRAAALAYVEEQIATLSGGNLLD